MSRTANSQKMDEIFANQGLAGVTTLILSKLNTKALVNCRLVSKSWKSVVDRQKFFYVRKLEKIASKNHDFFHGDDFRFVSHEKFLEVYKTFSSIKNLEDLQMMTKIMSEFFALDQFELEEYYYDPLEWSIWNNNLDYLKFLCRFCPSDYLNLVHYAGRSPRDDDEWNPFIMACTQGHIEIVRYFIDNSDKLGLDLNVKPKSHSWSAFMRAIGNIQLLVLKFSDYALSPNKFRIGIYQKIFPNLKRRKNCESLFIFC